MDPLNINIDIANHDASRPVLPNGTYGGIIASAAVVASKNTPGNHNLKITVKTLEPYESNKGTMLNPGFEISTWIPLQASEKQIESGQAEAYKDKIAQLVDNLLGTTAENRPAFTQEVITNMNGMEVNFTTNIEESDDFGASNRLGRIVAA